jgi:hypothetical protein
MVLPEFVGWPDIKIKFWRDSEERVLTAPMMNGLLEVQESIYRAFMLIEEDTSSLRHLSDYYREKFELKFTINSGSTEAQPKWHEIAAQFVSSVSGKISGRQATLIILGAMLLYAGNDSWSDYLASKAEIAKNQTQNQQMISLLDSHKQATELQREQTALLRDVLEQTDRGRALLDAADEGKEGVLKTAKRVDATQIGGASIEPEAAKRMARVPRAPNFAENVTGVFEIQRNDTTLADGFRVRLRDLATEEEFFATLRDRLVAPQDRDLIARAEWEKRPIRATIAITRRRGEVVKAQIVSAEEYDTAGLASR